MAYRYKNVLNKLADAGFTQNALRDAGALSQSVITRIRQNQSITLDSIDVICQLLHCTPNDIIEIIYEE